MFSTLRARLILSYVGVIGLTLAVVGFALFLLLLRNPLPAQSTYQNLAVVARLTMPILKNQPGDAERHLAYIAETSRYRLLQIDAERRVLYDSDGSLEGRRLRLNASSSASNRGTYRADDGRLWLYVSAPFDAPEHASEALVFATPRPRRSLVNILGDNLLRPLLQAGAIGLLFAVITGLLISRSVARPLETTVQASRAMAEGDYSQRIAEAGPEEVRRVAHAFNYMAEQVARTDRTQRDFLANISHELKTPLTSIQGYSQAILDGTALQPSRAAEVIHDEAGRMRRLVDDLLDLARIESGQSAFRIDNVNIRTIIEAVAANLALRLGERNCDLILDLGELQPVVGDGDRLAQVFTNLLANAVAHTPYGGQITVRAAEKSGGVQVTVTDTGGGIPARDLERVFDRFYQVDKSRQRTGDGGTGLGLAISREIVQQHGGRIWAESSPGEGAVFTVWLPQRRQG